MISDSYIDESENHKEERANNIHEDIFLPYIDVLTSITDYFSEWIKPIDVNKDYKKYFRNELSSLFEEDIKFICFNYTDTLEYLYNIKQEKICYIHGQTQSIHSGSSNINCRIRGIRRDGLMIDIARDLLG